MMLYSPVVSLTVWNGKVVVGCNNNRVQVRDILANARLQLEEPLRGFSDRVNCVAMMGEKIAIGGADATIQIVDVTVQRVVAEMKEHKRAARSMIPYGQYIASLGGEEILLWDISTGKVESRLPSGNVDFLEEFQGKLIAAGGEGLFVIDTETGEKQEVVKGSVLAFAADPETNIVAFNSRGMMEG